MMGLSAICALLVAQTPAERALEALRAANETRSVDAREGAAWEGERARLTVLLSTVEQEVKQLEAETAESKSRAAILRDAAKKLAPKQEKRDAVEALLTKMAEVITTALDRLAGELPPGVVPKKSDATTPLARFQATAARLDGAERNAESFGGDLVSGRLNGESRSVELLRLGGTAAWWRSLDGKNAGTAAMRDGTLTLTPAAPDVAARILSAIDIAKGRAAPRLVVLPFEGARR